MVYIAIAVSFLGLLAFLAFREWLKRQDFARRFEAELARTSETLRAEVAGAAAQAGGALDGRVKSLEARIGTIEAFAGIERKD